MLALTWPSKSPDEVLDYTLNWAPILGSDTITASSWALSSGEITKTNDTKTASTTTLWLSAGVANQSYSVTNTITTAAGRTFVQAVTITIVSAT